ncbi:MAG: DNA-directed RNA polymerase subunit omega [Candidatus Omnitrophica bacterium]|nr:DNA-directed RNA polymerase subunit omega [Candidatus Omnitrophota bacterium]
MKPKDNMSIEYLLQRVPSIFKLTNMASMRAMELNSGMKKLVESEPKTKCTTIAIKEILEGKVTLKEKKDD